MSKEFINTIDRNNTKAMNVVTVTTVAMENGLEGFDVVSLLEVISDYLKTNSTIFDQNM